MTECTLWGGSQAREIRNGLVAGRKGFGDGGGDLAHNIERGGYGVNQIHILQGQREIGLEIGGGRGISKGALEALDGEGKRALVGIHEAQTVVQLERLGVDMKGTAKKFGRIGDLGLLAQSQSQFDDGLGV